MTRYALHIGINYANPHDFADAQLDGAVHDALTLNAFTNALDFEAGSKQFAPSGALTDVDENGQLTPIRPTAEHIFDAMTEAAGRLTADDLLFVSFSGLGPPPDFANPNAVATRGLLCFDRLVLRFDDIVAALSQAPGGKIVLVCACCFIGPRNTEGFRRTARTLPARAVQMASARKDSPTFADTAAKFDGLEKKRKAAASSSDSGPIILHIAACALNEVIDDGTRTSNSPFVGELIKQLGVSTSRSFVEFIEALRSGLDPKPQFEFYLRGQQIQPGPSGLLAAAEAQFDDDILKEPADDFAGASVSQRKR
ncbi:MAG TPA: caspase family protein [Thermoanaerobaculia bacterium]|nr:caspase family protein [Thermoanaerobaculia bacterium]